MSCQPRDSIVSILATIADTHRPRLLLRAARIGTNDYRRETDLRRVLRLPAPPPPGPATVRMLIDLEAQQEDLRTRSGTHPGVSWRPARHVEVMIALMAEARLMAQCIQQPPGTAALPAAQSL
ncbi:MAG: DUF6477 family protein [Pararhodobacter sp.]